MNESALQVLVVDDDEDDFVLISDMFTDIPDTSFKLQWVESYDAALPVMADNSFDIYFVDFNLGSRTGVELVEEAIRGGMCFSCYHADRPERQRSGYYGDEGRGK